MKKLWRLLGGLLFVGGTAVVLVVLFPYLPDPTCAALLVRSDSNVPILLPANCARSRDVTADNMVKYLDKERTGRGLISKQWITCADVPVGGFAFMNDPHWLPSYVPGTYQFRRTVIIVSYAQPTPQGSPVIAEVCLMPWWKYVSQLAGQCDGKYKVWR